MAQAAPKSSGARNIAILVVLAAAGYGLYHYLHASSTVTIGTKDEVIYSGLSTQAQATALGNALKTDGYFQDLGVSVLLRKPIGGSTIISYVVKDGIWDNASMVSDYEVLTRDVATAVGGLPVEMRLVNSTQTVEKDETVTAQTGTQTGTPASTPAGTPPGTPAAPSSTVTIGTKDQVVYSGTATQAQATALGNALKTDGYFQDRGVTVLLNMGANGTTISFVVGDGDWNKPGTMGQFEEVAREVASSVGGLPVTVQLMDTHEDVEKTGVVGVVQLTGGDAVYYEGYSTLADGQALGQKLQSIGFFTGKGANVFLKKHTNGTTLAFVVTDGAWNDAKMVSDFETITRSVAPSIGGLPIDMRLLSTTLVVEKDEKLQ
ncbi:MAG: hypothetical protein ABR860_11770 [Terracidiphilus sp.]